MLRSPRWVTSRTWPNARGPTATEPPRQAVDSKTSLSARPRATMAWSQTASLAPRFRGQALPRPLAEIAGELPVDAVGGPRIVEVGGGVVAAERQRAVGGP